MRRQIQINSNVKNPTALAQFLTVVSSISAITQKIQYKKFTLKAGGYSNPDIVIYTLFVNMETNFDPVLCRPFLSPLHKYYQTPHSGSRGLSSTLTIANKYYTQSSFIFIIVSQILCNHGGGLHHHLYCCFLGSSICIKVNNLGRVFDSRNDVWWPSGVWSWQQFPSKTVIEILGSQQQVHINSNLCAT